ncbi:MAG: hypothetical protein ACRDTC_25360 [Pseudonocardiaceae bacterium]
MTGWKGSLIWMAAVLSGAAAVGLGLMVLLVDLSTAAQAGSVTGAVVSLIGLALSVNNLRQQSGNSGAGVTITGDNNTNVIRIDSSPLIIFGIIILAAVGIGMVILFSTQQPPITETQQPPTTERNGEIQENGSISGLSEPNVPCRRGCQDLQLSEGRDFDIETWGTADDTSNDIVVGNNSLQNYKIRPLNGAGIQPIPNIPAGALDAADCPTQGYSTGVIPIPPTVPFCLLTAEGTRVMLMGQEAFNLPFRAFLTSTLPH